MCICRKVIRLQGYDYTQNGMYFFTVCTKNRSLLFGECSGSKIVLNAAGYMIESFWRELETRFEGVVFDMYCVMPNHFHALVCIERSEGLHGGCGTGRESVRLGDIVGAFKSITTNEYGRRVKTENWKPFDGQLWQRSYYEHIVRDEAGLAQIRKYIENNPFAWSEDAENPACL